MQAVLDHEYTDFTISDAYQHLPDRHVLWMDICSLIVPGDAEKSERVLEWMLANVRGPWHWSVRHRHVGAPMDVATGLIDVRLELWVSIDDSDSAMLSKLAWMEFRSKEHADD